MYVTIKSVGFHRLPVSETDIDKAVSVILNAVASQTEGYRI